MKWYNEDMNIVHRYEDIILSPKYSPYLSRRDANPQLKFGNHTFRLPIVPSNMKAVINDSLARWMAQNNYFYIHHRFGDTQQFVQSLGATELCSISVGVKTEDRQLLKNLERKPDYITIDIAHGHCLAMQEMLEFIHKTCPDSFVIAGNIATPDAVEDLQNWGADAIKAGIAQGGACTTYGKTGFGGSMFSCIQRCSDVAKVPIIADGGIKTNGDIPKALVAGATMVMCGTLFAACVDSPAENLYKVYSPQECTKENITGKRYFGSASTANKTDWRHIEGQIIDIPCNHMTYAEKLSELEADLQSAMSYGGCQTLSDFVRVGWDVVY